MKLTYFITRARKGECLLQVLTFAILILGGHVLAGAPEDDKPYPVSMLGRLTGHQWYNLHSPSGTFE